MGFSKSNRKRKLRYVIPRRLIERRSIQVSISKSLQLNEEKEIIKDLEFEENISCQQGLCEEDAKHESTCEKWRGRQEM